MTTEDKFYLIPNTIFCQYPLPHKFDHVSLKSIYKYPLDNNRVRLLIILNADLKSKSQQIQKYFEQSEFIILEPSFSLNLTEIYVSYIYSQESNQTYGPEYFFMATREHPEDEDVFISNHGYWNLQFKSDLDVSRSELRQFMIPENKILSHLEGTQLLGQAISNTNDKHVVSIAGEQVFLSN